MNKTLPQRKLGAHINVSAMGFGAMGLSEFYGSSDDLASLSLLQNVIEQGVSLIDTADMYGRGANEILIGQWLAQLSTQQKQQLVIATKCGIDRSGASGYDRRINNDPEYIKKCCEESLRRLGVEQIDLYYIHRLNPDALIEETMSTLASLVREGKIARIGLCEVSVEQLKQAHAIYPVDVVQTEYSLWTRDIEDELLPVLKQLNVGLVPYSPLGRGFLTGKHHSHLDFEDGDFRKTNPRFSDQNIQQNQRFLKAIEPLAVKYQCSQGQIALAWLLAQWESIVPIPGTKRQAYLAENNQACFIHLDDADLNILNDLKNTLQVSGERYTLEGLKGIDKS